MKIFLAFSSLIAVTNFAHAEIPNFPSTLCSISYGGTPQSPKADVTSIFLLCTGSEDPLCPPEQILKFGRALQDAGIDWRMNVYGGAKHAFWARPANPAGGITHTEPTVPGVGYHPKHAVRAWQAVLDLIGETI